MKRLILFIVLTFILCSISALAQTQATVITERANLRAKASRKAKVVLTVKKGTRLSLLDNKSYRGWYPVTDLDGGRAGWIFGKNIKIDENQYPANLIISRNEDEKTVVDNPPVASGNVEEWTINKKPLLDLSAVVFEKAAKNEVDLNQPFLVVLDAVLTDDGRFDAKKSKFIKSEGDAQMVEVAKYSLEALGDSRILGFLKMSGVDRINFTFAQDDEKMFAVIVSEQKTPERAMTIASGLNTLFSLVKKVDENGIKKLDDKSRIIISNSSFKTEGSNFIMNISLPKSVAQEMINDSLKVGSEQK